jgi:hypothetical protein
MSSSPNKILISSFEEKFDIFINVLGYKLRNLTDDKLLRVVEQIGIKNNMNFKKKFFTKLTERQQMIVERFCNEQTVDESQNKKILESCVIEI